MIAPAETRAYVDAKIAAAQKNTINAVRKEYLERGSISADFAVQKWLEILTQDAIARAIRNDDSIATQNKTAQIKTATPKL